MFRTINSGQASETFSCNRASSVRLIISNLEPSVGLSEWKRILSAQIRVIIQVFHQINVYRQPEGGCYAIAKLTSLEDAHMIISQLNRRKLGCRRIRVSILNNTETIPLECQKKYVSKLLLSAPGQVLTISSFIHLFEKRYHRSITMSELYRMRDIVDVKSEVGRKNDRVISLINKMPDVPSNKISPDIKNPFRQISCSRDRQDFSQTPSQLCLPRVNISLSILRPNVTKLLQEQRDGILLHNFISCYESLYGPFIRENLKSFDEILSNSEIFKEHDMKQNEAETTQTQCCEISTMNHERSYVSLEHLLTCLPNVAIHPLENGILTVSLQENQSKSEASEGTPTQSCLQQENFRNLRREVVEMVKQQKDCEILLTNFIPTYHNLFGKQCRVADYGFTCLQDAIDALRGAVHVVGAGTSKTLLLTHGIQVRRFTHDLLRLLRVEPTKSCSISRIPHLYEQVFRRKFIPSNYGVCDIMDLLNDISENTIQVENTSSDTFINLPKRTQTAEQHMRTLLFGIEVVEMLGEMRNFQINFTKFIPAFHHKFNRQCRVSEYGFVKLMELLEALSHVVEITEENGEKMIRLTQHFRISLFQEMILSMLQAQTANRLPLNELQSTFFAHFHFELSLADFGASTLEKFDTAIPHTNIVHIQNKCTFDSSDLYQSENLSFTGDGPDIPAKACDDEKISANNHHTTCAYFCLSDRSCVKQIAQKCLQLLFNSPFGALFEQDFRKQYRYSFNEDVDMRLVQAELSNFVKVIGSSSDENGNKNSNDASVVMENIQYSIEESSRFWRNSNDENKSIEENKPCMTSSRLVSLSAIIIFARQLRIILLGSRGRLMLTMLETMYQRQFGVPLRPEVYGYPSLLTLVDAVKFVAVLRGRGSRATLFLSQDYLGKLVWKTAYNIKFRHQLFENIPNFPNSESILEQSRRDFIKTPEVASKPPAFNDSSYAFCDFGAWPTKNGDQAFMYQLNPVLNFPQTNKAFETITNDVISQTVISDQSCSEDQYVGKMQACPSLGLRNSNLPFMIGLGPATPELNSFNWNFIDCCGFQYLTNEHCNFPPIGEVGGNISTCPVSYVDHTLSGSENNFPYPFQSWPHFNLQLYPSNSIPHSDQERSTTITCNYLPPYCLHPLPLIPKQIDSPDENFYSKGEQLSPDSLVYFSNQDINQYCGNILQNTADSLNCITSSTNDPQSPYMNCPNFLLNWSETTHCIENEKSKTDYLLKNTHVPLTSFHDNYDGGGTNSAIWPVYIQRYPVNPAVETNWTLQNFPIQFFSQEDMNRETVLDNILQKQEPISSTTPPIEQPNQKAGMIDSCEKNTLSANRCEDGDWTLPISMTTESVDCNSKEIDDFCSLD